MGRRPKMAIELVSDIGCRAHDLHQHGDAAAVEAFKFIAQVNPELFAWLRDRLAESVADGDTAKVDGSEGRGASA